MSVQELELRPYQVEAIDALRQSVRAGNRRVILCAPTGAGKTEMAIQLIQAARDKGSRVVFICDRITLVEQTSARLGGYGIPHGIVQGANTRGADELVQVASAQTLKRRGGALEGYDLVIVDEAHTRHRSIEDFIQEEDSITVGLTATPLTKGLGLVYSGVVNATTTSSLVGTGYLAPLRIFAATPIDMTGAVTGVGGEWLAGEVEARTSAVLGHIVEEWVRYTTECFGGPVKTLVFSASVPHGRILCDAFAEAGFDFRQTSYRDSPAKTSRLIADFRAGEFTGLVSVDKLVKGFDVPDVRCMVGARPYKNSLMSFVQQLGRGMRVAEGKDYCLYLDHGQNMVRWYGDVFDLWDEGVRMLSDEEASGPAGGVQQGRLCPECSCIVPRGASFCPHCGFELPEPEAPPAPDAVMVEWPTGRDWLNSRQWVWGQLCMAAMDRRRGEPDKAPKTAAGYYRMFYGEWPPREWVYDPDPLAEIDDRVWRRLRKLRREFAKSMKARGG